MEHITKTKEPYLLGEIKSWEDVKNVMVEYIVDKTIKGELGTDEQTEYFQTIDIMSEIFNLPSLK